MLQTEEEFAKVMVDCRIWESKMRRKKALSERLDKKHWFYKKIALWWFEIKYKILED